MKNLWGPKVLMIRVKSQHMNLQVNQHNQQTKPVQHPLSSPLLSLFINLKRLLMRERQSESDLSRDGKDEAGMKTAEEDVG